MSSNAIDSHYINKYESAQESLEDAINTLRNIAAEGGDSEADIFADKLQSTLSSDNGEAGLAPYIARIS